MPGYPGAILERFGDLIRPDLRFALQVGYRPRDLEHTMIPTRRKSQANAGALQESTGVTVNGRVRIEPPASSMSVAPNAQIPCVTVSLPGVCCRDARTDRRRPFAGSVAAQLPECKRRHLHVQIDSVCERPGEAAAVTTGVGWRARAERPCVSGVAAGTGIRCCDKREAGRETNTVRCARYDNVPILHGLPQAIEYVPGELEHFIKEQNTVMRQAHLTRPRGTSTSDQSRG